MAHLDSCLPGVLKSLAKEALQRPGAILLLRQAC
jgi:hypothetical protein